MSMANLPFKWRYCNDSIGPQHGSWSATESNQMIEISVETADANEEEVIRNILGYSTVTGNYTTGPNLMLNPCPQRRLSRILPVSHPKFPWMRAMRCDAIERVPLFEQDAQDGLPIITDPDSDAHGYLPGDGFGPYRAYVRTRYQIQFQTLDFRLIDDTSIAETTDFLDPDDGGRPIERFRYVIRLQETTTENIKLPKERMRWYKYRAPGALDTFNFTPAGAPPTRPAAAGLAMADTAMIADANLVTKVAKTTFIYRWLDVPENYLMDENGIAANIVNCCTKVNDRTFDGMAPGTVLFGKAKITPSTPPVASKYTGFPFAARDICGRYYTVELPAVYFNPPVERDGYSFRGHNLVPHPSSPTLNRSNRFYYLISVDGQSTDSGLLYQSVDPFSIWRPPSTQLEQPLA